MYACMVLILERAGIDVPTGRVLASYIITYVVCGGFIFFLQIEPLPNPTQTLPQRTLSHGKRGFQF